MRIINADDYGRTPSINMAISECFKQGIIDRASLMVTMPYIDEAIELAIKHNFINKIGLHINIDDGYPLTNEIKQCPIFCNKKGEFNSVFKSKFIYKFFIFGKKNRKALQNEIEAQIVKFNNLGCSLKHIDSHHHIHTMPSILPFIIKAGKKYCFESMRIRMNLEYSNVFKKFYSLICNLIIKKSFKVTHYFCSSNYFINHQISKSKSTEIMCHPDVINNTIYDIIGKRDNNMKITINQLI